MQKIATAAAVLFALTLPVHAQDLTFTTEDADHMTSCTEPLLERMRDGDGAEASGEVSPMALEQCIGVASGVCMEAPGGSSNAGMDTCMAREIDWWDSQLNVHYTSLIDQIDEESATALQEAQRAWIAARDAGCDFEYTYWREGTIRSIYYSSCMLNETARRAIDLQSYVLWLEL